MPLAPTKQQMFLEKMSFKTLVVNRIHEGQVSASVSKSLRQKELRYVRQKFAASTSFSGFLEYLRQRIKAL